MKFYARLFVILGAVFFIFSTEAFACACCAEPGAYSISTYKPKQYEIELLQDIKFDNAAYLFMTEAGFDGIKGLDAIAKSYNSNSWTAAPGYFSLSNIFSAKTWKFNLKTKDGKTGILTLPLPFEMLNFKADIHDGKMISGSGPLLYKEWRFKGNLQSGTGFFTSGIVKPTSYFLVLQGRGNNCDNAEDFTHWRLEIDGRKASYAFFGKLTSGNVESN